MERPYDLWNACNLNGGEWDDSQAMVDHFYWNEFEWNTNFSNTWELSDYLCEVYYLVVLF